MHRPLRPTAGARLLFERDAVTGDEARYRATIHTPDASIEYTVTLGLDGSAVLEPVADPASPELEKQLINLARSTARAAKRKLAEDLPPWPARVLRWRGPGRG